MVDYKKKYLKYKKKYINTKNIIGGMNGDGTKGYKTWAARLWSNKTPPAEENMPLQEQEQIIQEQRQIIEEMQKQIDSFEERRHEFYFKSSVEKDKMKTQIREEKEKLLKCETDKKKVMEAGKDWEKIGKEIKEDWLKKVEELEKV